MHTCAGPQGSGLSVHLAEDTVAHSNRNNLRLEALAYVKLLLI